MKDQVITGINMLENQVLIAKEHLQSQEFSKCSDSINSSLHILQTLREYLENNLK